MIGQLTGTITYKGDRFVILNAGGVGYKVFITPETMTALASNIPDTILWTHLVVREDVLDLYGFIDQQELEFFQLLITVSGIGPRSALAILSLAGPETLRRAILSGNTEYLTKVSGIGKKSADKIVLELKDKLEKLGEFLPHEELNAEADVLNALQALGYSTREAREALKKIPEGVTDTGEKIKLALKQLGK
jgi:Holliday junction DNA helicase RuvA